ncbi:oleate activated transcription factor 3, partial [Colletotrichum tofieldiae]
LMFSRASASLSRGLRIAQMLGLHRLDSPRQTMISTLPPPEDWCELEERRRTWWVIFCSDRFVSGVTGWPALIHEKDVATLLPASDDSFEQGLEEETGLLADALQGTLAYSSFAGKILSAYVYHKTLDHTFQTSPGDSPEDVKNGPYWKRHREIDSHLHNLIMYLPERLRLPQNAKDNNALFFTISIYSSTICIHRAALAKVREFDLPGSMFLWSKLRLLPAADEVVNALKLAVDIQSILLDHYVAFSAYLVALVFLESYKELPSQRSQSSLEFLLSSLVACGRQDLFTRSLALQLARGMTQCEVRSSALAEVLRFGFLY